MYNPNSCGAHSAAHPLPPYAMDSASAHGHVPTPYTSHSLSQVSHPATLPYMVHPATHTYAQESASGHPHIPAQTPSHVLPTVRAHPYMAGQPPPPPPAPQASASSQASPPPSNAITLLNQLLCKTQLPPISIVLQRVGGKDHNPVFEGRCTWKIDSRPTITFRYRAGSKANAKRGVAHVLLSALRNHINDQTHPDQAHQKLSHAWRNIEDAAIRVGMEADKVLPEDNKQESKMASNKPQSYALSRNQSRPHREPNRDRHQEQIRRQSSLHPEQNQYQNQRQEPYPQSHYDQQLRQPQQYNVPVQNVYSQPQDLTPLSYVIDRNGDRNAMSSNESSSTRSTILKQNAQSNIGRPTATRHDSSSSVFSGSSHSSLGQGQGHGHASGHYYSGERWRSPNNRGNEQYRHRSEYNQRGALPLQPQPPSRLPSQYNGHSYDGRNNSQHLLSNNLQYQSNDIRSVPRPAENTSARDSRNGSGSRIALLKTEQLTVPKTKPQRPSFSKAKLGQDSKPSSTNTDTNDSNSTCELPCIPRKPSVPSRDPRVRRPRPSPCADVSKVKQESRLERSNMHLYEQVVRGPPVKIEKKKLFPMRNNPIANVDTVATTPDARASPSSVKRILVVPRTELSGGVQDSPNIAREQLKSKLMNSSPYAAREQTKSLCLIHSGNEQKSKMTTQPAEAAQAEKLKVSENERNNHPNPPKSVVQAQTIAKGKVSSMNETRSTERDDLAISKPVDGNKVVQMAQVEPCANNEQSSTKAVSKPPAEIVKMMETKDTKSTRSEKQITPKPTDSDKPRKTKELECAQNDKQSFAKQVDESVIAGAKLKDVQKKKSLEIQGKTVETEQSRKVTENRSTEISTDVHGPRFCNSQVISVSNKDNGTQILDFPTSSVTVGGTDAKPARGNKLKELENESRNGDVRKTATDIILKEGKNGEKTEKLSDITKEENEEQDSSPPTARSIRALRRRSVPEFVPRRSPRRLSSSADEKMKKRPRPNVEKQVGINKLINGLSKDTKGKNSRQVKRSRKSRGRRIDDSDSDDSSVLQNEIKVEIMEESQNVDDKKEIVNGSPDVLAKEKPNADAMTSLSNEKPNVKLVTTPLEKSKLGVTDEDERDELNTENDKEGRNVATNGAESDKFTEKSEMMVTKASFDVATDSSLIVVSTPVSNFTHEKLDGISIRSTILGYQRSPLSPTSLTSRALANGGSSGGDLLRPVKKRPRIETMPKSSRTKYRLSLFASLVEESVYELIVGSSYGLPNEVQLAVNLYSNYGAKKKYPRLRTTKNRTVHYFEELRTTEGGLRCAIMADASGKMVELIRERADAKLDPNIAQGINLEFSHVVVITNHSDLFSRGQVEVVKANKLPEYLAYIHDSFVRNCRAE